MTDSTVVRERRENQLLLLFLLESKERQNESLRQEDMRYVGERQNNRKRKVSLLLLLQEIGSWAHTQKAMCGKASPFPVLSVFFLFEFFQRAKRKKKRVRGGRCQSVNSLQQPDDRNIIIISFFFWNNKKVLNWVIFLLFPISGVMNNARRAAHERLSSNVTTAESFPDSRP